MVDMVDICREQVRVTYVTVAAAAVLLGVTATVCAVVCYGS
jgi:hypothetical protein